MTVTIIVTATALINKRGVIVSQCVTVVLHTYARAHERAGVISIFYIIQFHNVYNHITMTSMTLLCRAVVVRVSAVTLCVTVGFFLYDTMTQVYKTVKKGVSCR
jgi:hypothetical protein